VERAYCLAIVELDKGELVDVVGLDMLRDSIGDLGVLFLQSLNVCHSKKKKKKKKRITWVKNLSIE
jgi:hypothetical protein